jgi:hypothetical protein
MTNSTPLPFAGAVPAELEEETRAIIEHAMTRKPLDPAIAERVRTEAARVRQEVFERHGLLDEAVPGVREFRDR